MDRTGIIVISLCVALLGVWLYEQKEYASKLAAWQAAHPAPVPTNSVAAAGSTPASPATGTGPAPVTPVMFDTNAPEQTLVLTNGSARYTFTSRGGGLKLIELLDYPETVSARWRNDVHDTEKFASLNTKAEVPVLAVLGDASFVGDGNFTLTPTATGVRADKTLTNGLVISKQFSFSSNYLVNADITLQNTSDKTLILPPQEFVVGTATPMDVDDANAPQNSGAMWYDGTNATTQPLMWFQGRSGGCGRGTPRDEFLTGATTVVWAAAHNQFFAMLAMPKQPAMEMIARTVTLPRFQDTGMATNAPAPQGVETAMLYPSLTLTANASVDRQIVLFAGPKEFRTLSRISDEFKNNADQVMNFGSGYMSFWGVGTFFAKLLLSAMNAIHDVTRIGYGWCIVIVTVLIRALFWPLTAASTRSMKRMQALQPEMTALKEKYKDDQQKLMSKQMELWKQHGVSPMSGCWPMLIQMPVFFGFFTMIRSAIELRGASFLWAADLSKPDTLFMIPGLTFIPLLSSPEGLAFNLLPLMMVSVMLWQSHLTPPSPGMDPAQQKMMRWLPGIFILFLYNYSSGLSLYMTISTTMSVIQTKITKNLKDPALKKTAALTPAPKSKK